MSQQIKVTRKLDATGAVKLGFQDIANAFTAIGRILYVDNTYGADGYDGKDPNYPKKTIQSAIDACSDYYHDYIFVTRRASTDYTTTTPILMNKHTVHLIGVANHTPQGALIRLVHTNATDNVLEFPDGGVGNHCEIAGFGFAGGATSKGGICATGTGGGQTGAWIHHCNFGGILTKETPAYGIFDEGGEFQAGVIEDNTFYGSGHNAKGLLATDGIYLSTHGSSNSKHLIIRNNLFMGIPGVAINLASVSGVMIIANQFALDAETSGAAITLQSSCLGCFCTWNDSQYGSTNAMTNGGFRDLAAGDANVWASNWNAGAIVYPASS